MKMTMIGWVERVGMGEVGKGTKERKGDMRKVGE